MKNILLPFLLILFVSCASGLNKDQHTLREVIEKEEARSLHEIQGHSELLLDQHPELSLGIKEKLRTGLREMLANHQKLKDQESKIIQSLLNRSLTNRPTQEEKTEVKLLKKALLEVYSQKSKNVLNLVDQINEMSEANQLNQGVKDDLFILIREMR